MSFQLCMLLPPASPRNNAGTTSHPPQDRLRRGGAKPCIPLVCCSFLIGCRIARGLYRPLQVGLEAHGVRLLAEAGTIDLDVGQHLLHIVARLLERNAMDPVDRIDAAVTRIAELLDPFPSPP